MQNKVVIYGFDSALKYCMYCEMAKNLCKSRKIEYIFKSVIEPKDNDLKFDYNEEVKQELLQKLGKSELAGTTMPQIFVGDVHVGGFTDFKDKVTSGEIVL